MSSYPPPFPEPPPFASQPMPVLPVNYATPMTGGRPGMLTAIGVISVVLGCFGLLSSVGGVIAGLVFGTMGRTTMTFPAPATMPVAMSPSANSVSVNSTGNMLVGDEDALDSTTATTVVNMMMTRHALDAQQQVQLQALLAQAGKKVFPGDASARTYSVIRNNISEARTIRGVSGKKSTYFVVGTGRIEVYGDHALFRPDGSSDTVSVSASGDASAPMITAQGGGPAVTYTPGVRTGSMSMPGRMAPTTAPIRTISIPGPAAGMLVISTIEGVFGLGVAAVLLTAGILTLRDSRKARSLHWIYIWTKIPLVLAASVSGWLMMQSTLTSMPASPAMRMSWFSGMMLIGMIFSCVIGLAYPVTLMFVLMTRRVKEYYAGIVQG